MIVDAHTHVWDLDRAPYPWLGPHAPAWNRTFTLDEVLPSMRRCGVGAAVLVQASDSDADTDLMLVTADEHPEVVGVVAYLPLERPAEAAERLAVLRRDPRVVGVRNLTHDQPDPDWILRADVAESLALVEAAGLTLDYVATLPRHLEHVPTLAGRFPGLRLVVDHLATPPVGAGPAEREPWWSLIARAAEAPQVHAKVSGLYGSPDRAAWDADALRPFVHHAVELFGARRLMYGGDWPISVTAGGYERVFAGLSTVLSDLDGADRAEVLAGTAQRCYGLSLPGGG